MKRYLPVFILTLICSTLLNAQTGTQYQVLVERPNEKSLKGILSRDAIVNDTSFKWYADAQKIYTPNPGAVEALQQKKDTIQLIVFMGTWCDDSHFVIPRFFKLVDAAGFTDNRITLIGVDRAKTTISHLSEALNVKNVPTIIVMQNGKEKGRVVEYGTSGSFDKDLGDILKSF
jgi:thiol-disulfide isomerase/thioredoxin